MQSELMADRAAEVLRHVTPAEPDETTEKSLGNIGDYRLIQLIGVGSTGVVFHAIDRTLDRSVALKVLRPSLGSVARERFMAEARSAAQIEHANVVTIYQVGQQDRLAYIAMQWLPGETLESKFSRLQTTSEDDIRAIVAKVASGLTAAHSKQIVHRDIKPANVWICEDTNEVKILDFGLARIADDDPGLTATGMLAGTPNYMSPEQSKGQELDGRSDLFSLGCIMYRALTGRLPFRAPSILATLQAIQLETPIPPIVLREDISQDISDLTMCLLERHPSNRPDSASQLLQMLESERCQWQTQVKHSPSSPDSNPAVQTSDNIANPTPTGLRVDSQESKLPPPTKTTNKLIRNWWLAPAAIAMLIGGLLFSPQIIRIISDQGEIVVETSDENIEINILQDGKIVRVLDTKTNKSFNIRSGSYEIEAVSSGDADPKNTFQIAPNQLTMKRGEKVVVKVKKQPNQPSSQSPSNSIVNSIDGQGLQASEVPTDFQKLSRKRQSFLLSEIDKNLNELKISKHELSEKFGASHPRIKSVESQIGFLETQRAGLEQEMRESSATAQGWVNPPNGSNKVFDGKGFQHWVNVAMFDQHTETICLALKACSKLATLDSEKQQLMQIFSRLVRLHGSNFIGASKESDQFTSAFNDTLKTLSTDEAIDFLLAEIKSGNKKSRSYCDLLLSQGFLHNQMDSNNAGDIAKTLIARGIELLETLEVGIKEDESLVPIFNGVVNLLASQPRDSQPVESNDRAFRDWIKQKYFGENSMTLEKTRLGFGFLANAFLADETDFFDLLVDRFFNKSISKTERDQIFTQIGRSENGDKKAMTLILILSKMFPNEAKIFEPVLTHEEHISPSFKTAKRSGAKPVFSSLNSIFHKQNGGVAGEHPNRFSTEYPVMFNDNVGLGGWFGFSGGGGGGGYFPSSAFALPAGARGERTVVYQENGQQMTAKKVSGPATITRRVVTLLWTMEPALSEEFKSDVLVPFLDEMAGVIKNGEDKKLFEQLSVIRDVYALILRCEGKIQPLNLNGVASEDEAMYNGTEDSKFPVSEFVLEALRPSVDNAMNSISDGGIF